MNSLYKLLFAVIMLCCIHLPATAQNNQTNDLIKQGVDLHNAGKYAEAIAKYDEVLKTDPDNAYANYEMAFSLYVLKKSTEAIPHLQKAIKSTNSSLNVAAYSLLASIYDEGNQPQKAIETYNLAIKINPDYPQIYYNLGISYFRNQQYGEAENAAVEAIKHNPKNASSMRLYALVTFHQNKRANALLALCNFLLLEPNSPRSAEAYNNIQHILQGGVLKDDKGNSAITISPGDEKEMSALNLSISMTVLSAESKKLIGMDMFEYQLKNIFAIAGELSEKKTSKNFFDTFFAAYFYKLSQTSNMPAVAHTIALTDRKYENAKWIKANAAQVSAMEEWIKTTERLF